MDLSVPMRLFLGEVLFGEIISYFYETPWADGKLVPEDNQQLLGMIEATELANEIESWPDDENDEDDELWNAALKRRGITDEIVNQQTFGPWYVETQDKKRHPISQVMFEKKIL